MKLIKIFIAYKINLVYKIYRFLKFKNKIKKILI